MKNFNEFVQSSNYDQFAKFGYILQTKGYGIYVETVDDESFNDNLIDGLEGKIISIPIVDEKLQKKIRLSDEDLYILGTDNRIFLSADTGESELDFSSAKDVAALVVSLFRLIGKKSEFPLPNIFGEDIVNFLFKNKNCNLRVKKNRNKYTVTLNKKCMWQFIELCIENCYYSAVKMREEGDNVVLSVS